jgi:hypothetical protein
MAYVAITLEYAHEKKDLALPMNVPTRLLVESIIQIMKLPHSNGQKLALGIRMEQGLRRIPINANLGDSNVLHGAMLTLLLEENDKIVVQTGARLKAESGQTFPLAASTTLIGRNDPKSGIFVDIDLSSEAREPKAISRRHARIEQEGDRFYVTDLDSANGTKLNGKRLESSKKHPLWEGDLLELGHGAAKLFFKKEENEE